MLVYRPADGQSCFSLSRDQISPRAAQIGRPASHVAGGEVVDKAPAPVMDVGSGCSSDGLDLRLPSGRESGGTHTLWKL